jgi:hypothetical protein
MRTKSALTFVVSAIVAKTLIVSFNMFGIKLIFEHTTNAAVYNSEPVMTGD